MKKHDEGYALVLVLVVMVVLCLVATSVLTIALNNLKKQEDSAARMRAKYEAQGKIEEFYAKLQCDIEQQIYALEPVSEELEDATHPTTIAQYVVPQNLLSIINKDLEGNPLVEVSEEDVAEEENRLGILKPNEGDKVLKIRIKAYGLGPNGEQVCIVCELAIHSTECVTENVLDDNTVSYTLVEPSLGYSAYEVTVVAPGEGGDGT